MADHSRTLLAGLAIGLLLLGCTSPCPAQLGRPSNPGLASPELGNPRLGQSFTQRWQVGIVVRAQGGPCAGLFGTAAVPVDWPEQQIRVLEEERTPNVQGFKYRDLPGGVRQMLVLIPSLRVGETARAVVTFEVTTRGLLPPADPSQYVLPTKMSREVRLHLGTSPLIEARHGSIRARARTIMQQEGSAWQQAEAICDWVRANVEYRHGQGKLIGAAAALRDGHGDKEDLTSLFIALCRAAKIPARTVWIPNDSYAEFYLEDAQHQGAWFPCQVAGEKIFGQMPEPHPILQKGDNIRVPEKKEPQRYVGEFLKGRSGRGFGKPGVVFVRHLLAAE